MSDRPYLTLELYPDQVEGLADLLSEQYSDSGFLELSEFLYSWLDNGPDRA